MKRMMFLALLCLNLTAYLKAEPIKIYYEKKDSGYVLYADNVELFPVSVSMQFNLTNMLFSENENKIFVVPGKTEKFKMGDLTVLDRHSRFGVNYKFRSTMGDVTISNYDSSFEYDLPFQKGKSYKMFQGYNGEFSHEGENALDFTMPEGSDVLAAREGIVVTVVQNNTESCPSSDCEKYNNYITIMHADGSFASYAHIKYMSAKFKVGDSVKKNNVIALSGNVGWSSGPHLHFVCFLGAFKKKKTLETKFKIDNGDKVVLLQEGNIYGRNY